MISAASEEVVSTFKRSRISEIRRTWRILDFVGREGVKVAVQVAVVELRKRKQVSTSNLQTASTWTHLMPVEGVLLPLVDLELLDVVAVLDHANAANVRSRDGVGMHRRDNDAVVGDIAVRDVAGAEVVPYSHAKLGRRNTAGRAGCRRSGRVGRGFGDGLEDLDHTGDEVGFALAVVPWWRNVDVVCGRGAGRGRGEREVRRWREGGKRSARRGERRRKQTDRSGRGACHQRPVALTP